MTGRPRTACRRCNAQKVLHYALWWQNTGLALISKSHGFQVRCSGLRPVCERCRRSGRPCIYEDRTGAPLESDQASSRATLPEDRASSTTIADQQPIADQQHQISGSGTSSHGIPSKLMHELVEIYFTHITNSVLLLHKATFIQQLINNQVRDHVILSVCASAAK